MRSDLDRQLREYSRQMDEKQGALSVDDILERSAELQVIPGRKNRHPSPPRSSAKTQTLGPRRGLAWAVAAFVVILAIGGLYFAFSGGDGQVVDQTTVPSPTTVVPWSTESVFQDWPGPLRPEPAGTEDLNFFASHEDPEGDAGLDVVDINEVLARLGCWMTLTTERCVNFDTVSPPEPMPNPADTWIAYGIVVDYTGDGHPDVRFGIDNAPDSGALRMWRTDLTTGETLTPGVGSLEDPLPPPSGAGMDADLPDSETFESGNGHIWVKKTQGERTFRFYVWASVIRDGEIVATDYAPDAGWMTINGTATTESTDTSVGESVLGWPSTMRNPPGVYSWDGDRCAGDSCTIGIMHNGYGSGDVEIQFHRTGSEPITDDSATAVTIAGHDTVYRRIDDETENWRVEFDGQMFSITLTAEPGTSQADLAEAHAIIDSIRTEPSDNTVGYRLVFTLTTDDWDSG